MDARTHKALMASIAKWERNAEAKTPDDYLTGPEDCALCMLFFSKDCHGCPVSARTGESTCYGSPYGDAFLAWLAWSRWERGEPALAAHAAARKEVAFLKSLLPEGAS